MTSLASSEPAQTVSRESVEIIRCGVGDDVYCLEMSAVASVLPAGDLRLHASNEPNAPAGFLVYRGQELPVFDLSSLLNRPSESTRGSHYVVLIHHPAQSYGLRVDSVSRVIPLPQENVLPLPKPLEHTRRWFRGIADFTRERHVSRDAFSSRHLPGISEPREVPSNRRRNPHQMQLLLNPKTLLSEKAADPDPPLASEPLLRRYAAVDALGRPGGVRQLVVYPVGLKNDRQILMGLSISQVAEISEPLALAAIPGANETVRGFAQWRNCPLPVLDFRVPLNCREEGEPVSHWIVVRDPKSRGLFALPVSGRIQSLRLPIAHRPCTLPDARWKPFVLGAFEFEERLLIIPRLEALSSDDSLAAGR